MTTPQQTNQVPDHRLQELQEQLRLERERNSQLQGLVNQIAVRETSPRQQQQPNPEDQLFKPEVNEAIDRKVQRMLEAERVQLKAAFGTVNDRSDALQFQVQYGPDTYKKYGPKIEALRAQRMQQTGQMISREDAYKFVAFEETDRKPKETPINAQPVVPTYDPYYQTVKSPTTAAVADPQAPAPQAQPLNQQLSPELQKAINDLGYVPKNQQVPRDADINLPPDVTPAPGTVSAGSPQLGPIDLTTDEKSLDAWASKNSGVEF